MGNEGESRLYPLCFYDGKREFNIGQVRIHSSLDYKTFQSILSQKIGISPNQMSIYFVNNNPKQERRTLITGKASFNLTCLQEKDCTVLVVLKRSRKHRKQSSKLISNVNNFDLLCRSVPDYYACPVWPYYDEFAGQQFISFRNLYNYPVMFKKPYFVPERGDNYRYCDECMNARSEGKVVQFHLCVNDAVTESFRSSAGPIARPGG